MDNLTFPKSVRLNIYRTPIRRITDANFVLSSRWPVEHILGNDGREPEVFRNARNACTLALIKRTQEAVAEARSAFVDAARAAGILAVR
ncbi:DUF982 domain-containing protein [Chelatococcus albus]|uniref:DUF982 domain-containing protein n=1 Tax=Chelatococcus albus TaxID=3047466 RepID=UPI003BEEE2FA